MVEQAAPPAEAARRGPETVPVAGAVRRTRHRPDNPRSRPVICPPCAEMADFVTENGLSEGHPPEMCRDHGRQIRACGCQHRPQHAPDPAADEPGGEL